VLHSILHAVHVFAEHLRAVGWGALGIAVGLHLTKLCARTRAWRNILAAAHPDVTVRWRHAFGAYAAGAAVNAVVPARSGDVVKLYLIRQRIAGSRYPTLAATLAVDTLFDFVVSLSLFLWALEQNVLPGLDVVGRLRAIDWSWAERHPRAALIVAGAVLVLLALAAVLLRRRAEGIVRQVRAGGAILAQPRRYLRSVVSLQALDWLLRIATIFFLLRAFGIPATVHNALLVQVSQSLSTLVPLTPGGIGTEQGLVVYVFSRKAAAAAVLAFSVGMKATLLTTNLVVGFVALALMLRTLHIFRSVADVRVRQRRELADQRGGEEDETESDLVEAP
jgi:uncharacterized membrane protein YbhN (UPF0104 family)